MKYINIILGLLGIYIFAFTRKPELIVYREEDYTSIIKMQQYGCMTFFTTPATLWVNGMTGNDGTGTGTFNKPFATMTGAFNYFHTNTTLSPVTVNVFAGSYNNPTTGISWTENTIDSSRSLAFFSYGGPVYITGGATLPDTAWHRPTDTTVTDRIQAGALNHVWVMNLPAQGITNYGNLRCTDNNLQPNSTSAMEVFINRVPQQLARWPNAHGNYFSIDSVMPIGPVGNVTGVIGSFDVSYCYSGMFPTNRPATWRPHKSSANGSEGFLSYNDYLFRGTCGLQYTSDNGKIDSVDPVHDSIWLGTYPAHGFHPSSITGASQVNGALIGFYYYNIPEELDTLGEYWLDSAKGNLYVYDDSSILSAYVQVSLLGGTYPTNIPLFTLTSAANVSFNGIYFECSRGQGLNLTKCDNILLNQSSVANIGGIGVVCNSSATTGCRNIVFNYVTLTGMGQGALDLNGLGLAGNARTTLIGQGCVVRNCLISNWSRNYRAGSIGITAIGVGDTIMNCDITDDPAGAIDFQGNNHYIAYNRIQRVQYRFADQGAIYTDRDPSSTGTLIYGNFFDSITNIGHNGEVSAVYLDDETSGISVGQNFYRLCGSGGHGAIHVNGGGYNVFWNQTFYNCYECFSGNGLTTAQWNSIWVYGADSSIIKPYVSLAVYATAYPWFAPNFFSDTTFATNPLNNNVNNSLMYGSAYPTFAPASGNWVVSDSGSTVLVFRNAAIGNYDVVTTPSIATSWAGYTNFNFDSTGIINPTLVGLGSIQSNNFSR